HRRAAPDILAGRVGADQVADLLVQLHVPLDVASTAVVLVDDGGRRTGGAVGIQCVGQNGLLFGTAFVPDGGDRYEVADAHDADGSRRYAGCSHRVIGGWMNGSSALPNDARPRAARTGTQGEKILL